MILNSLAFNINNVLLNYHWWSDEILVENRESI